MAKVFIPNSSRLIELNFDSIAHIPVLFDRAERYLREHNWYIRDRGTGEFIPNPEGQMISGAPPRQKTILNIAHHLGIFVDWCEDKFVDWREMSYFDCLSFQKAMDEGNWSPSGRKLSRSTINQRIDEVTSFLQWAARRGLRNEFNVPLRSVRRSYHTGGPRSYNRVGKRSRVDRLKTSRGSTMDLVVMLPTHEEVGHWLKSVKIHRGTAKYLACRFILESGVRLNELVSLQESQIPLASDLNELRNKGFMFGAITLVVTKGDTPRQIQVSLEFLDELRLWMDTKRLRLRSVYFKREKVQPSKNLFLSDAIGYEGIPIRSYTIYDCFKNVIPHPKKWHPHFGRHVYACFTVLETLKWEAKAAGSLINNMGAEWIQSRGTIILKTLQRQLGHAGEETTELYLKWLITAVGISTVAVNWQQYLDSEED